MTAALQPRLLALLGLLVAVAANAALAAGLTIGMKAIVLLALLPLLVFALAGLATAGAWPLVFVAFALPVTQHALNKPYPVGGGLSVWVSDVIVLVALACWIGSRLAGGTIHMPRTPVLGWPYLVFVGVLLIALLRGHEAWGQSLVGEPTRLFLYAGIAGAIASLEPKRALRGIVLIAYVGTVWMLLNAAYYIATGTSQTHSEDLSTGGTRVLSGSVSIYLAAALFLALLNLQLDAGARRRGVHVVIASLALVGVALGYFRAVFVVVALVVPLLLLRRRVRGPLVSVAPFALPFVVLFALFLPRVAPDLVPNLVDRVSASPRADANVQWRERASAAIWEQAESSPLIGVGFGKSSYLTVFDESQSGLILPRRETLGQHGHNSYLWLLAGGGLVTLGAFLLLVATYFVDTIRRLRRTRDLHERTLLVWCMAALIGFLIPGLSGPVLGGPPLLLCIWIVLLLPSIVQPSPQLSR